MKKIIMIFLSVLMLSNVYSQVIKMNSTTNGQTFNICSGSFYDNNENGNYLNNQDDTITLCPNNVGRRIKLTFNTFNIDNSDALYIYSGTSVFNNPMTNATTNTLEFNGTVLNGMSITPSPVDNSGCLTLRFHSDNSITQVGWKATIECENKCQDFGARLDSVFTKYSADGNVTTKTIRHLYDIDTYGDTVHYDAIDICEGDSIMIKANPNFYYNDITYHQSDSTCIYYWSFGDGMGDTINYTASVGHYWPVVDGYNLNLIIYDTSNGGCTTKNTIDTRIRIASNPIKIVAPLQDICSNDRLMVNVDYNGNSSIIVDSIHHNQHQHGEYSVPTFIPDGACPGSPNVTCYESPITFTDFTPGAVLQTIDQLEDICVYMEHSFIDDLSMFIICPNGQSATLKYKTGSEGTYLGIPMGGINHDNHDNTTYGNCDTSVNPIGTCWRYCWSNQLLNNAQGVISGHTPNHILSGNNIPNGSSTTIDSTHYYSDSYFFQTPIQNMSATPTEVSDLTGFSSLVGCPLNGTWIFRVCDDWKIDNGWICSWDLDLKNTSASNWTYQVPIDTVIWNGPFITEQTPTTSMIQPPIDTGGTFIYDITIIDDFGCEWDTTTHINVVKTPVVELGNDISACEGSATLLDAGNQGAYAYNWSNGDTTQTTIAHFPLNNSSNTITYVVQVTNFNGNLYCYGMDSIHLTILPSATAAFSASPQPMEGCEPLTINITSNSTNVEQYEWIIGDYHYTDANPTFTLPYGTYDLKLKTTSVDGCVDSIYLHHIISVFKMPRADFGWDPSLISTSDPTIHLINMTDSYSNVQLWQIETDHNGGIVNNLHDNPTYTWQRHNDEPLYGEYDVKLNVSIINNAPSGNNYTCTDTITKTITIINDNILFPNVITPNGDGINDVFYITNFIGGRAFPNNELAIYNRYGKRIYFKSDLRNEEDFWNPNDTYSPTGTYFYRFVGRGPLRDVTFTGTVEVIR